MRRIINLITGKIVIIFTLLITFYICAARISHINSIKTFELNFPIHLLDTTENSFPLDVRNTCEHLEKNILIERLFLVPIKQDRIKSKSTFLKNKYLIEETTESPILYIKLEAKDRIKEWYIFKGDLIPLYNYDKSEISYYYKLGNNQSQNNSEKGQNIVDFMNQNSEITISYKWLSNQPMKYMLTSRLWYND